MVLTSNTLNQEHRQIQPSVWKGKGVPTLRNKKHPWNTYRQVCCSGPEKLNAAQKEALRKFQEAMGEVAPSEKKEEAPHEKHEKHKKKGFFKK